MESGAFMFISFICLLGLPQVNAGLNPVSGIINSLNPNLEPDNIRPESIGAQRKHLSKPTNTCSILQHTCLPSEKAPTACYEP